MNEAEFSKVVVGLAFQQKGRARQVAEACKAILTKNMFIKGYSPYKIDGYR